MATSTRVEGGGGGSKKKRAYKPAVSKATAKVISMDNSAKMLKMMKSKQKKMGM